MRLPADQYGALIDNRLRTTRRHVKGVDVAAALLLLGTASLAYLLLVAIADHWLVKGGLGTGARVGLLAAWLVAGGLYFVRGVLPPLLRRVNPVFAAQTIEQTKPTLKNSLVNFLLLRGHRDEVVPMIYRAMEHRAAADLAQVPIDSVVDRSRIIRLGYVFTAVVVAICLYAAFSHKNPFISFERLIWPWADIPAPSRVKIEQVQPGDIPSFQGEFVTVSAEISGLKGDEQASVIYSTADGQTIDQAIPLTVPDGGYRYRCVLPPGSRGLQQDLWYYLVAGDCRTRRYRVEAQINPIITVDRVDFHYPPYTAIPDRSAEREGDIRAIEGTQVTIHAQANQEIQHADIDLDCTGVRPVRMKVADTSASGQFTLRLKPDDIARPEHDCYQLRFTDRHGRENRKPIRYRIEVVRDLPPEVQIVDPQQDDIQVPENGRLEIRVRAEDPDYALRRVALRAEKEGRGLAISPLLHRPLPQPPWKGEFTASYSLEPAKLELKAGDHITYWAEADDNKGDDEPVPQPNHTETTKRWITIVAAQQGGGQQPHRAPRDQRPSSGGKGEPGEQANQPSDSKNPTPDQPQKPADPNRDQTSKDKNDASGKNDQPDQQREGQPDQSSAGKTGQSQGQPSKSNQQPGTPGGSQNDSSPQNSDGGKSDQPSQAQSQPVDDKTDPGTAFEQILKQAEQQKQKEKTPQDQLASSDNAKKQPPDQKQQQPGEKQSGGEKQPGQQPSGEKQPGQQPSGEKQPGQQPSGEKQPGQQPSGEKQPGQQPSGEKQPGQQPSGEKQPGQQPSGEKQPGQQPSGQQPSGQQPSGQQPSGQQPSGQQPSGEKPSGQQPSGQQPSGQQPSGEKQPGQQPSGEKQPGQQPSGEKQPGQQPSGEKQPGKQPSGQQPSGQQPSGQQPSGQQPSGQQPSGEKPSGQQPSGQQPSGQQPSGQQPSGQQPSGQQPSGQQPSGEKQPGQQPSGEKQSAEKRPGESTPQPGEKQQSSQTTGGSKDSHSGQRSSDNQVAKKESTELAQRPDPNQGAKAMTSGEKQEPPQGQNAAPKPGGEKGGNPDDNGGKTGAGKPSDQPQTGTTPQESNTDRNKKPGESVSKDSDQKGEEGQSGSVSKKQSDSQGDTAGSHSGGGEKGGGQKSNQSGTGSAGSHTPSDQGGKKSNERGDGETGTKSGNQAKSDKGTNQPGAKTQGQGAQASSGKGGDQSPGGNASETASAAGQTPPSSSNNAGKPNDKPSDQGDGQGSNGPGAGGQPRQGPGEGSSAGPSAQSKPEAPNLEFANKQTDLALEYLKDQLAKEKPDPDLLKRLNWSKDTLQRFYDRWMEMKRAAGQEGPQSGPARKQLDDALKSLGLRPRNLSLKGDTERDQFRSQHEQRRIDPPSGWGEWQKAYSEGLSRQK
jgi:hypothetical protein